MTRLWKKWGAVLFIGLPLIAMAVAAGDTKTESVTSCGGGTCTQYSFYYIWVSPPGMTGYWSLFNTSTRTYPDPRYIREK